MGEQVQALQQLMKCGDPWIEQQAGMALEIADAQALGNITSEQAKELMEDLIKTDEIEGKSENIQLVGALVTGVMGLASIV